MGTFKNQKLPFWIFMLGLTFSVTLSGFHPQSALGSVLASSSWSSPSSWTTEGGSSGRKSSYSQNSSQQEVSPFSPGSHNLALDVGQVFLVGDLSKYNDSIGTQLHYTYGVSDLFGFDSSFGYSSHSDGKFSMLTLLAGMRMNLTWYDKVVPYAVFGLGFYKPTYDDLTTPAGTTAAQPVFNNPSISDTLFGLHLGPGVDLELSRNIFFGAALTLHRMFTSNRNYANGSPLSVGGTYASFYAHIGLTF